MLGKACSDIAKIHIACLKDKQFEKREIA